MMLQQPVVSVIVPVFNAGQYLLPAINSVLSQTHRNIEIIIVNDGSTDGCLETIAHLSDPRIRIIHQLNAGKPSAMNRGVEAALGEFVVVMDADDIAHPDRVRRLLEESSKHNLAAVMSGYTLLLRNKPAAPISNAKDERACKEDIMAFRMPSHDPTLMVRTEVARELRFDPELPVVEGYDFILRLGERYPIRVVPEILYSYRVHFASVTRTNIPRRIGLQNEASRKAALRRGLDPDALFPKKDWNRVVLKNWHFDNGLPTEFIRSVRCLVRSGHRSAAIMQGINCSLLHPLDKDYHRALTYAFLPQRVADRISPNIG
jgi:glycosyltransferase involved in cell wall biosynthesis